MTNSGGGIPVYLFVLPWSLEYLGGVNQVVINLARQMKKIGTFDPVVLITDWNAKRPEWKTIHGVRVVHWRVRELPQGWNLKQRIVRLFWLIGFAPAFWSFCRDLNVAIVNHHYPTAAAFTLDALCRQMNPAPLTIFSFHGADVSGLQTATAAHISAWRSMLRRAHRVIVCSAALGQRVQNLLGIVPEVIHNGIDSAEFCALAGASVRASRRKILSVGKFEEKKGQDVLLRAFAAIADDYSDLELVLVGATDKALPYLRILCRQLGLDHRVQFILDLPHHEVAKCFAEATVFVLPSRQEPFGIVLLEAGCLSLPVVASAVGGIPEILEDGVTARLVAPDRPDELAIALRELLEDDVLSRAMGVRLRAHVVENFSWTVAHNSYVQSARANY